MAQEEAGEKIRTRPWLTGVVLLGGMVAVVLGFVASISVGVADISFFTVWQAIFQFNPDLAQHQIIQELRLPRTLTCVFVGAAFAVAGAIMQGMTRNPMADPGLLGINAGAGFVLALCFAFLPGLPFHILILFSFIGAAVGTGLVYGIGSFTKGGLHPIRLVLAGAAVTALLAALSEGIALYYKIGRDLAFWYAGGVAGASWLQVQVIVPWIVGGLIAALLLSRSITILSLGEDVAVGLGQRTGLIKLLASMVVLVLAGAAVSAVGAIALVGLVIPHMVRFLVGVDYRWIIPGSALLGSVLTLVADIGARMVNPPAETPLGTIIALLGVPFFLYLARKEKREL